MAVSIADETMEAVTDAATYDSQSVDYDEAGEDAYDPSQIIVFSASPW